MPHGEILAVMGQRIKDKKFLSLIARLLKAGVETPGGWLPAEVGSPQGSIVWPVIANIYLDELLDQWIATVVKRHCRGYCMHIRYVDDSLVGFECADDAERFMQVLPKRLTKYGLCLNAAKTHLLEFGKRQARPVLRTWGQLPTLDFLGFTHYWGRSRQGQVRLKRKTAKQRYSRALHRFERAAPRRLFKWLNRRSQRRSFTWESFRRYQARYPLPQPGRLGSLNPVW